jgi:anti-sigma B factor antagonist
MNVHCENKDGVLIVKFEGNLDTSTAPAAEAEVNTQLESNDKMIFDLSSTEYVSSAGLRVFLATAKQLTAKGGSLRMCGANEVVSEVLQISGFTTILDVRDTLEAALTDF